MNKAEKDKMFSEARIRIKIKKFFTNIPAGMAQQLPDSLVDSWSDEELTYALTYIRSNVLWEAEPNGYYSKR